ncbi:MAG: hypothetical protein J5714_03640 [Alphaproteobacteria bacterium]|nr:hypothetical protein [Alphaproteobacteria bacterium]
MTYVDWQPSNSQESSHAPEFSPHDLPVSLDLEYKKQRWYETSSFEEAMFMGRNGWPEMAKEVKDVVVNPWDTLIDVRPWNPIHSIAGSSTDTNAYIAGVPECMFRQNDSVGKSVNVVINVGHAYRIRPSEIAKNGKQIVDIVNAFEINNIHTRLVIMVAVSDDAKDLFRTFVVCKDLYDNFDLKRVMFAVAHPSFLRRLWFAMAERESMEIRNKFSFLFDGDYGRVVRDFEYKNDKKILYFVVTKENKYSIMKNQMFDIAKSHLFSYSEFNQNLQDLTQQRIIKIDKSY